MITLRDGSGRQWWSPVEAASAYQFMIEQLMEEEDVLPSGLLYAEDGKEFEVVVKVRVVPV